MDPSLIEQATRLSQQAEQRSQPNEASPAAVEEIEAAFDEKVQFVANLSDEYHNALQKIGVLKEKNQKLMAQTEKLAQQIKEKKAIIQDLRTEGQHYKWLRSSFRALHETFRRGPRGDES